ncbi:MAG TPA: hypothetical protein PK384_12120 [Candidatus Latescibacteria bacterium]|nr:hypothetical protein [Candidatus Latescibacterota bacterium]
MEFSEDSGRGATELEGAEVHECGVADGGGFDTGPVRGGDDSLERWGHGWGAVPGLFGWDELEADCDWGECRLGKAESKEQKWKDCIQSFDGRGGL